MTGRADDDLYARDIAAWCVTQARALQEGRLGDLDHEHVAGVIEELGAERSRELRARLGVVMTGLLRWAEQVDLRNRAWAATIDIQRLQIKHILEESPSLHSEVPVLIASIYADAKTRAVLESALFDDSFPGACPFTDEEVLRQGFLPDPYGDDAIRGEGWWKRAPT